jgi:hypothetical protein
MPVVLAATIQAENLIYVANLENTTIGEYTDSGSTVNASLFSGLDAPTGVAISGNELFVATFAGDTINEYTTNGSTVGAPLITGLNYPALLAISSNDLFVANYQGGSVGEYTTSGSTLHATLITGLSEPVGIAISGTNLFVANWSSGTIGEYTTSGLVVNASLITGLDYPTGIAVVPVPEPVAAVLQAVIVGEQLDLTVSGPTNSTIVLASTNMANWVRVYTNTPPFTFTDSMTTVFPCHFYRAMTPQ